MATALSDSPPDIVLSGVEKTFASRSGPVAAVGRIDLSVGRGEFISLLGPSGCGKTTLLRIIAGLETASQGETLIRKMPVLRNGTRSREATRHLAMMFQEPNLFPWFSVEDNVALPLQLRGVERGQRRERARELCELVGLAGFERLRPRDLSGGMRQRAALARALTVKPQILLLDEPFGALDAMTRDAMNLELQRICAASDVTVVLVTHSIQEAVFLSDRIVVLAPRPSRVLSVHDIGFHRPRAVDLQRSPAFQDKVAQIRSEITGSGS